MKILCGSDGKNKGDSKDCYICMEPINYYFKYECGCHNYCHYECASEIGIGLGIGTQTGFQYDTETNAQTNAQTIAQTNVQTICAVRKCIICKKINYIQIIPISHINSHFSNFFCNIFLLKLFIKKTKVDKYIGNLLQLTISIKNLTMPLKILMLFIFIANSFVFTIGIIVPVYIANVIINIFILIYKKIF